MSKGEKGGSARSRWRPTTSFGPCGPGETAVCLTRRHPPTEHLILVGGPSNTFNGYIYLSKENKWKAQPAPACLEGVPAYMNQRQDDALSPKPITHDVFWGNFCFPVLSLFDPQLRCEPRPQPRPGDLITVMVHWDAYIERQRIDWEASPNSGNFLESDLGDKPGQVFRPAPPIPSFSWGPARPAPPTQHVVSDTRINHEILMRTRSRDVAPIKRFVRVPDRPDHYTDLVRDIPRIIVLGPDMSGDTPLKGVLVKLCFLRKKADFFAYMKTGKWHGPRLPHALAVVSGMDGKLPTNPSVTIHNAGYDVCSMEKPKEAAMFWRDTPSVDRTQVKIARFDYFGHSGPKSLGLEYGLSNKKGQEPTPNPAQLVTTDELVAATNGGAVFSPKAFVQLWGCHLAKEMAPVLAAEAKVHVRACRGKTDFSRVLDLSQGGLPVPANGGAWEDFG